MSKSVVVCVVLALGIVGTAWLFSGTRAPQSPRPPARPLPLAELSIVANDAETERDMQNFCGGCHAVPRPELLPRLAWPEEISKAYRRYHQSDRHDLVAPDRGAITEYFMRLAPEELVFAEDERATPGPLVFQPQIIEMPDDRPLGTVSYLAPLMKARGGWDAQRTDLLLCDVGTGWIEQFAWNEGKMSRTSIGRLRNSSHIIECDFDQDGHQDFVLADLGVLMPSDEMKGSVVLARSLGPGNGFDFIKVQEGLGRVADAQLADLDGDGDNDFIVAEFGFEKAGRIVWLETVSITNGRPETQMHVIDPRHGSIHCPVVDLDRDGDLDLIVLISQEHECIVSFLNDGHGQFEKRTLFEANNPSFGSSGMELTDLDQDGDLDVLFTNGDTMDTFQIRPFHAVNWLENQGNLQFEYHQLAKLPGATRAVAGDFDNDGDLDIAATAYYPRELRFQKRPPTLDTLIWLEQTSPGTFERHLIESSSLGHMALAVGDFDGDLDCDIAVGEFPPVDSTDRKWFTIYWNQNKPALGDRGSVSQLETRP